MIEPKIKDLGRRVRSTSMNYDLRGYVTSWEPIGTKGELRVNIFLEVFRDLPDDKDVANGTGKIGWERASTLEWIEPYFRPEASEPD